MELVGEAARDFSYARLSAIAGIEAVPGWSSLSLP